MPMNNIHHRAAILLQRLEKRIVVCVAMRVGDIIVDPNAVNQIERVFPPIVIFIECVIEIILQNGIDADGVCTQLLHLRKPAQIRLLIDGIIRRPLSGDTNAHIHPADLKGRARALLGCQVDLFFFCAHKGGYLGIRVPIDINAKLIVGNIAHQKHQNDDASGDDKFLQAWPTPFCTSP